MFPDSLAWIAFNLIPGIGPVRAQRLVAACGSAAAVFATPAEVLARTPGVPPGLAELIAGFSWQDEAEKELERCDRIGCEILTLAEADYPELLRAIPAPPLVLYLRGGLDPTDARALAVVGTRFPTGFGLTAAQTLSAGAARAGFTIVSGLAYGIDAIAHQAALAAGGRTLAVVGHGLDQIYPSEHRELHDRIVECGAVISEFPLGMQPHKGNFPQRNRLISGLALGVLVVEAGIKSGALITAHWALEQNREVLAVPGQWNSPLSAGTHALIQDGAKLVTRVQDILEEFSVKSGCDATAPEPAPTAVRPPQGLTDGQQRIWQALAAGPTHVDQLAAACGQSTSGVLVELLDLELQGLIQAAPGQIYQCK